jgi:hypothetical protein
VVVRIWVGGCLGVGGGGWDDGAEEWCLCVCVCVCGVEGEGKLKYVHICIHLHHMWVHYRLWMYS